MSNEKNQKKKLKEFEELHQFVLKHIPLPDDAFFEEMRRNLFGKIRSMRPSKEILLPVRRRRLALVLVPVTTALVLLVGLWVLPSRYQEFTMKKDLAELAKLEETESLEEEVAMVDEFLMLTQAEESTRGETLEEEIELLNALREGEGLSEEEMEELEEELAALDEEALG